MPLFWDTNFMLNLCSPSARKWANLLKGCQLSFLIFISCLSLQFELQKFTGQILNKEYALSPVIVWQILFPPGVLPLAAKKTYFQCTKSRIYLNTSGIWLWPNLLLPYLLWYKPDLASNEESIRYQEIEKSTSNRLEVFGECKTLV